jgi:hypothetical protein
MQKYLYITLFMQGVFHVSVSYAMTNVATAKKQTSWVGRYFNMPVNAYIQESFRPTVEYLKQEIANNTARVEQNRALYGAEQALRMKKLAEYELYQKNPSRLVNRYTRRPLPQEQYWPHINKDYIDPLAVNAGWVRAESGNAQAYKNLEDVIGAQVQEERDRRRKAYERRVGQELGNYGSSRVQDVMRGRSGW